MSATGKRLSLAEADSMAAGIIEQIDGEAHVVGSIRRRKSDVGDIEILVHRDAEINLDIGVGPLYPGEYEKIKGGPRKTAAAPWRYWQIRHRDSGVHVDLFRCDDKNRGSQMIIRTGPADFSQHFVTMLRRHGCYHDRGYVWDSDDHIVMECPTEHDAFLLAHMTYTQPENRH